MSLSPRWAVDVGHRRWWTLRRGDSPVMASAIHDGTDLRSEARERIKLADDVRAREEDPHTGVMIASVPNSIVVHRSRFEVDLNRPRASAVYRTADEAWGLDVWNQPADQDFVDRSLRLHDSFYATMKTVLQQMVGVYGHFVLLDIHSYNHRRNGPDSAATPQELAPEVNIGTHSMPGGRWDSVVAAATHTIRNFDYRGRSLDVRCNVAFQGKGELTRFVHKHFADTGCAIAIEFKKFYMDEWTGVPFSHDIAALQKMIAALVPVLTSVGGACAKSGAGGSGVHSSR